MEFTVIGISGAIAVLVVGLEVGRQMQRGAGLGGMQALIQMPGLRQTLIMALGITAALALGLVGITSVAGSWPLVLGGGLWGLISVGSSPLGRSAQALGVMGACVWTATLSMEDPSLLPQLAALGLGLGLVGVPAWLVLTPGAGLALSTGLAQGWLLIAASTWGVRLADLMEGETGWYRVLPCGLAALALVGGTVPLLVTEPGERSPEMDPDAGDPHPGTPRSRWIGQIIGGIVASLLGIGLVRNWLHQGLFYPLAFGIGVGLSLLLLAIEESHSQARGEVGPPSRGLQQGILSLALVGGGALLALRLGGSYGAVVIGLGLLTFPSRWGVMAALFLGARPLVQSLLYEFDLNLSGINITHSYTYAALFLGIGAIAIAVLVRWIYGDRAVSLIAVGLPTGSVLLTGLTGYFIHLRPQAAMVLGALMVALVIAALEPTVIRIWTGAEERQRAGIPQGWGLQGLMLAMLAILTALVSTDLTQAGAQATRVERLWVLAGVLALGLGLIGVGSWWRHRSGSEAGNRHGRI